MAFQRYQIYWILLNVQKVIMAWKISAVIKKSYFNNFDTVESKLSFLWILWNFCAITSHDKVAQYCIVGYWKKKKQDWNFDPLNSRVAMALRCIMWKHWTEAAIRGVLCKKVFLEISQNSQENTCARVSFLIKLQLNKV